VQRLQVTVNGPLLQCNADEPISRFEPLWNFGASLGGTMGKGREPQIILKKDQRTILLELGLGGKF
jgi:hypothetical protein